jgi:hypothetical protein
VSQSCCFIALVDVIRRSCRAPRHFGSHSQTVVGQYCNVVKNYLNYVLMHNVSLEYTDDILAARAVCDRAATELSALVQVERLLPGDFNTAASTLFDGYYADMFVEDASWITDVDGSKMQLGMSRPQAERIFKTAVSLVASDAQFDAYRACHESPSVVLRELRSFEVANIIMPDQTTTHGFAGVKDVRGAVGTIEPLGVVELRTWANPEAPVKDLTEEEELEARRAQTATERGQELVRLHLEASVLSGMYPGMHFSCHLHTLDIGLSFIDCVTGLYVSFFDFLPNERMVSWKEPREDPRPPPMVGADEDAADDFGDL